LVFIRDYVAAHNLPVKVVMTVHDQIDTICRNDQVSDWAVVMKGLMEQAALEIVSNGLLKAEVTVSNCWEK